LRVRSPVSPELKLGIRRAAVPWFLAGLLYACSGALDFGGAGSFMARVEGDVNATLEGTATAHRRSVTVGEGYNLELLVPDEGVRGIYFYSASRPQMGTHEVLPFTIEQPPTGVRAVFMSEPNGGGFESIAGLLRITESSGRRLAGTFEFRAVDPLPGRERVVRVEGSFSIR
jgi:hypothetical protein